MTPEEPLPGRPSSEPGWAETTTPLPPGLPTPVVGGSSAVPTSKGPPIPPPLLPVPRPPREPEAPERLGGGGTTLLAITPVPKAPCGLRPAPESVEPALTFGGGGTTVPVATAVPIPPALLAWPLPPPDRADPGLILGGGGTTWLVPIKPGTARLSCERPPSCTGGGTTLGSARAAPETLRSRVTCEGGGAITGVAGSVSRAVWDVSRGGTETGGGTTVAVVAAGPRRGSGSCCTSGAG